MGKIKGQREYNTFLEGKSLTRKQAILANCFMCNGLEGSNVDCQGKKCPLYQYQSFHRRKRRIVEAGNSDFVGVQEVKTDVNSNP